VSPGLPAGFTVRVRRDAEGLLTSAPMGADEIRSRAYGRAATAGAAVALTGPAAHPVVARFLDGRRDAAWERAWAGISPRWTTSAGGP
jgi:hypothetical protein